MVHSSIPAESSTLGTPTQRYECTVGDNGDLFLGLFFVVVGLFFLYHTYFAIIDGSNHGTNFILGFVTVAAFVIAFFLIRAWRKYHGLYVQMYSDGFVRVKGEKAHEVRWDDIDAVWQNITKRYRNGIYAGTIYLYTVQTNDLRTLKFGNEIKGIEQLGQTIQNESTKHLLPKMLAAYNAGQDVTFGHFTIRKEGVQYLTNSLSWTDFESVHIDKGFVIFKNYDKRFDWAKVPVADIPNLPTFLSLVDQIIGLKRGT